MGKNTILQEALSLASAGCCVYALADMSNKPRKGSHAFKDATTEAAVIHEWWRENPRANLAVATGSVSGYWILDVDVKHGDTVEALLEELTLRGGGDVFPQTLSATTPSGGKHFWFRLPEGAVVKSRASIKVGGVKIVGLDTRGDGGGIACPPSVRRDGVYAWSPCTTANPLDSVADTPDWLLHAVSEPAPQKTSQVYSFSQERAARGTKTPHVIHRSCERVRQAAPGERHSTLSRTAYVVGGWIAYGDVELVTAQPALIEAGIDAGLDVVEVERTVRGQILEGMKKPVPLRQQRSTLNDAGNALRLLRKHGKDVRFCPSLPGGWLVWDGTRWRQDSSQVRRWASDISYDLYNEADAVEDEEVKKHLRKWARQSGDHRRIKDSVHNAQDAAGVRVDVAELNQRSDSLCTPGSTYDLREFTTGDHRRDDLSTLCTSLDPDFDAEPTRWLQFLDEVMCGDQDLVEYLRLAVGYTLSGSTAEQVMFICYGAGANGKSTFFDVLQYVLGSYARTIAVDSLLRNNSGRVPSDIAALAGTRFVLTNEAPQGGRLNESLVKALTGGDAIPARYLHKEWFSFTPQFKLWMATNHLPYIRGGDKGIWRRLVTIPWNADFSGAEKDPNLPARLRKEAPAILAWAIRGSADWYVDGLTPSSAIKSTVAQYRDVMDVLGEFIEDRLEDAEEKRTISKAMLYAAYTQWCEKMGHKAMSQRGFTMELQRRGFTAGRSKAGRFWVGVALTG